MTWTLTNHAIESYRILHPDAEPADMLASLDSSLQVLPEVVGPVVGRKRRSDHATGLYYVDEPRLGVWVVDEDGSKVITFLRLYSERQRALARRLWGGPDEPRPDVEELVPDGTGVSHGAARAFRGGRPEVRTYCRANQPSSPVDWYMQVLIEGANERLVPDAVWHVRDDLTLGLCRGRIGIAHRVEEPTHRRPQHEAELDELTCPVGPVRQLRVTERLMQLLGAGLGTHQEVRRRRRNRLRRWAASATWTRCENTQVSGIGREHWVLDATGYNRIDLDEVVACERADDEWWLGSQLPPPPDTETLHLAARLRARGWGVYPPPWDLALESDDE